MRRSTQGRRVWAHKKEKRNIIANRTDYHTMYTKFHTIFSSTLCSSYRWDPFHIQNGWNVTSLWRKKFCMTSQLKQQQGWGEREAMLKENKTHLCVDSSKTRSIQKSYHHFKLKQKLKWANLMSSSLLFDVEINKIFCISFLSYIVNFCDGILKATQTNESEWDAHERWTWSSKVT